MSDRSSRPDCTAVRGNPPRRNPPRRMPAWMAYFVLGVAAVVGSFWIAPRWPLAGWLEYPVAGFCWILAGLLLVIRLAGRRDVLIGACVVGVLAGWVLVIAAFVFAGPVDDYFSRLEFDAAAWKADGREDGERPDRQRMIHDLLDRGLLDGRTAAEVDRLLGAPDAGRSGPGGDVTYVLGPDRGFGIDSELFVVRFGPDATVVETFRRTD